MVTVYVEEVDDTPEPMVSLVEPSGISERESLSSLLYMMDHPPTKDAEIIADIDRLMEYDLFTDAMGRRLLAVRGDDVEEDRLVAAQYLLDHSGHEDVLDLDTRPRVTRRTRRAPDSALGAWLRDLALGHEEVDSGVRLLPGGYVTAHTYEEDEPSDVADVEDDEELLGEDEEYLDWLGMQLLHCHSGVHPYIIDGVHENGDGSVLAYTLESSTFVSRVGSPLTLDEYDDDELGTSPNQRPRKSVRLQERS